MTANVLLAGDVGGTKTHIGLFDAHAADDARDAPRPLERRTYVSADFDGLASVIERFFADVGSAPPALASACFGVAGPVVGGKVETPNLPWHLDAGALGARFGVERFELVNDLVANAEGIAALRDDELHTLNEGVVRPRAKGTPPEPGALISAGTGLGMALLVPDQASGGWIPMPSEGGHADFAPQTRHEQGLWQLLSHRFPDHVSVERVVSGPAIPHVYAYAYSAMSDHVRSKPALDAAMAACAEDLPRQISAAALDGDQIAKFAMKLFSSIYGAVAGNLALTAMATGGVYVGGGVAPKILPLLDQHFMESFTRKGRFQEFMQAIPVRVVLNSDAAFYGAARRALRAMIAQGSEAG